MDTDSRAELNITPSADRSAERHRGKQRLRVARGRGAWNGAGLVDIPGGAPPHSCRHCDSQSAAMSSRSIMPHCCALHLLQGHDKQYRFG